MAVATQRVSLRDAALAGGDGHAGLAMALRTLRAATMRDAQTLTLGGDH